MLRELNKLENLKKTLPAYQPLSSLGLFSHLFHEKTGYITPQKRPLIHLLHFLSDFRFFSAKQKIISGCSSTILVLQTSQSKNTLQKS